MITNDLLKKKILYYFFENVAKKYETKLEKTKDNFEIQTGKKDANFGDSSGEYPFYTCALVPIKSKTYSYDGEYLILPGNGANVGATVYFDGKFEAYQRTYLISSKNDMVDMKYAYYYFLAYWQDYNQNKMYGSAIPYIRLGNLENFEILYPKDIFVQKEIATKISDMFALVDSKKKNDQEKIKLKSILKEKILDSAIHGTLVDNNSNLKPIEVEEIKEDIPFDIPSNWKWTKWGNLSSSIQYGVSASATDMGNAKLVRITDIQNNKIVWNSVPFCKINEKDIEKYLLKENDILFARTGGTVGKSVMVKNIPSDNNYVFAGYLIRSNYDDTKAFYKYLKMFMDSSLYWEQLKKGSIGMAQPNCNGKTLGNMFIPLPPLEEQKKIVEKIESLFELIEQL